MVLADYTAKSLNWKMGAMTEVTRYWINQMWKVVYLQVKTWENQGQCSESLLLDHKGQEWIFNLSLKGI